MQAEVHKEMAYQVIVDYPNPHLLEYLLDGVAKPEWKKDQATKIRPLAMASYLDITVSTRNAYFSAICSRSRRSHSCS